MIDVPEDFREASYTAPDKFLDDDRVARNILSAVAETRLEQTPSGNVMFPNTQDSFTDSLRSVHDDGDSNQKGWTAASSSKKCTTDVMQNLSPKKSNKHCADTDAANVFKENSNEIVISPSSSPRRRQQRNMTDLEYCEDLVVATAVYDHTTVDSGEDGYMPTCIEYDPDSKPSEYRNAFYRRMLYAFLIVTVMMIGVIVYAVKRVNGSKNEMEWMRQEVETLLGSKIELYDVSYRKALDWMMFDDPHRFELSMIPRDDSEFRQRFILTQFYFATSKDSEWIYCAPPKAEIDDPFCSYRDFVSGVLTSQEKQKYRWLSDSHTCEWAGVDCSSNQEIEGLRVDSFKLSGSFPEGIQYLSTLKTISLVDSNLQGPLPRDVTKRLPQLTSLFLGLNKFTGSIPLQWFTDEPSLSSNSNISYSSLIDLELNMNLLTGVIPPQMARFNKLEVLSLNDNQFEGTIPKEVMGGMPSLKRIQFSMNRFTGTIPSSIGQLTNLYLLAIAGNKLYGTIPTEIGLLKESMVDVRIGSNVFSGELPKEFYGLNHLLKLDISTNRFNGTLNPMIGRSFPILRILYINHNAFTGSIPTQMETMMYLEDFVFSNNELTGTLPKGMCQFVGERCCQVKCCTVDGDDCPTFNEVANP